MLTNRPLPRPIPFFLVLFLILPACSLLQTTPAGELVTETHSLERDSAAAVKVAVIMDEGELAIQSSPTRLLEGSFAYNLPAWKPEVVYEVSGDQGTLTIDQPQKARGLVRNGQNTWDLRLGEGIPLDIGIMLGAGDSLIDLSQLDLTAFSIDTGSGDLDLDLRGSWARDIPVKLRTGSGDIAIRLPATIGVRVDVSTGSGDITQTGLQMDGDAYVNAAYGQSPHTLNLTIETGSGDIHLEG